MKRIKKEEALNNNASSIPMHDYDLLPDSFTTILRSLILLDKLSILLSNLTNKEAPTAIGKQVLDINVTI